MPTHVSHQKYLLKKHTLCTDHRYKQKPSRKALESQPYTELQLKSMPDFCWEFTTSICWLKSTRVHSMFTKEQIHTVETQRKNALIYWEISLLFMVIKKTLATRHLLLHWRQMFSSAIQQKYKRITAVVPELRDNVKSVQKSFILVLIRWKGGEVFLTVT